MADGVGKLGGVVSWVVVVVVDECWRVVGESCFVGALHLVVVVRLLARQAVGTARFQPQGPPKEFGMPGI